MLVVYKGRGEGKTEELLQLAAKDQLTLVLMNRSECMRVQRRASDLGLAVPMPMTHLDFLEGHRGGHRTKGLLIDNAEVLLQKMTHISVVAISINKKEQDV